MSRFRKMRCYLPAQWLRLLIFGNPDIAATSHDGGDYHSQQGWPFSDRETVRAARAHRAIRSVVDKALTDRQITDLPVPICGQVNPLINSV